MLRIGVCDNDLEVLSDIKKRLSTISIQYDLDFKVFIFDCGKSLTDYYEKDQLDILLLDIEMDDSDGMIVASKIRNYYHDQQVKIVFISSHDEYVFRSFDVSAYHFLVKPIHSSKFKEIILRLYNSLTDIDGKEKIVFKLKLDGEKQIISKDKIVAIELIDSPQRLLNVYTMNECFEVTGRLNSYWNELKAHNFFKTYRSVIINLNYLNRIKDTSIIMDNKLELALSRLIKKELKAKYSKLMIDNYSFSMKK
ncbi:LytR/AlgR family response regulator transcription factor [Enterococcus casseliflavus]